MGLMDYSHNVPYLQDTLLCRAIRKLNLGTRHILCVGRRDPFHALAFRYQWTDSSDTNLSTFFHRVPSFL